MRGYLRGSVDEELDAGALAAKTLISAGFDETVSETTRVSSIVGTYSLSDVTPGLGIGPILVGLAHGDYQDSEIEAVIEATDSWEPKDLIAMEVGARKVRRIGIFASPESSQLTVRLNDGRPIKTKLNWTLQSGQTLKIWAYNLGVNPFATTTPRIDLQGHANLWTQR